MYISNAGDGVVARNSRDGGLKFSGASSGPNAMLLRHPSCDLRDTPWDHWPVSLNGRTTLWGFPIVFARRERYEGLAHISGSAPSADLIETPPDNTTFPCLSRDLSQSLYYDILRDRRNHPAYKRRLYPSVTESLY